MMLRILVMALLLAGCQKATQPVASSTPPQAPSSEAVAPESASVDAVCPSVDAGLGLAEAAQCLPGKKQTGAGCDMAGIMAAIAPLRQARGAIPTCYVTHVKPPRQGKMQLRFSLTPDGRPAQWQWLKDEIDAPGLQACLQQALSSIRYPAPGDKPCQVVYPFTFIPEVRRGP